LFVFLVAYKTPHLIQLNAQKLNPTATFFSTILSSKGLLDTILALVLLKLPLLNYINLVHNVHYSLLEHSPVMSSIYIMDILLILLAIMRSSILFYATASAMITFNIVAFFGMKDTKKALLLGNHQILKLIFSNTSFMIKTSSKICPKTFLPVK